GQAGIDVPRTAAHQRRMVQPIRRTDLAPGDLVFFDITGKTDHVGVYLGDGRFVHAPSSGKQVQVGQLDNGYFARHFTAAGRVPGAGAPLERP
ncbi:MAG: C40 family peptidase, partial [Pseudomonadota bacterium]